ncbi:calcium/sodium antiporter [candidate division CSSED10-310 bacterium]|uniref:Calcium/sodium antiporter n=1 Tax=candidate division CSSED10-310 bacterium TaxID=2855610 RepID=A0ABV6Z3I2_UNCC1
MFMDFWLVIFGFIFLIGGAELCVRGASSIAERLGISKSLIGLTIVALGTSLPEMIVSYVASIEGEPSIAVGNVIGSNIANITLILGSAALMSPLLTDKGILRKEIPFMVLSALAILVFSLNSIISRLEGLLLLTMFAVFIGSTIMRYKQETAQEDHSKGPKNHMALNLFITLCGFVLLVFGGKWVVLGGKNLARGFGVSEWLIGLTIVALGTSLPELATSMVAAFKGELEISVGNVIGSNLFNSLCVLGGATAICPAGVSHGEIYRDILLMVILSILIYPIARSGMQISRREGAFLLSAYLLFMISLIMSPQWSVF